MPPLTSLRTGAACKYCERPTKVVTLVTAPPGHAAPEELFAKPRLTTTVCDYCDRYSDQPTSGEELEAA